MAGRESTRGMGKSVIVAIQRKETWQNVATTGEDNCSVKHVGKVLMMVLLERLIAQMEPHLSEEQAGFRKDRCTTHQILILRLMAEKAKRKLQFSAASKGYNDTRRWIRVLSSKTIGPFKKKKCICFINTKARLFCDMRSCRMTLKRSTPTSSCQ